MQVGKYNLKATCDLEDADQVLEAEIDTCDLEADDQILEAKMEPDNLSEDAHYKNKDPGCQRPKYQVELTRKEHPAGYLDPEHHQGIQHPGLGENPPKEMEDI